MKNLSPRVEAFISIVLAAILGGGIPVFSKIALKQVDPVSFTFMRFAIASFCLLPLVMTSKDKKEKGIGRAVIISLLGTGNVLLFSIGVRLTTATISQMLYAVVPVIAAIFSFFILKEKYTKRKNLGIFFGLAGVAILILAPMIGKGASSGSLPGNLIVMSAVTSFTLYTVLSKPLQKKFSPILLTFVLATTTAITLFPFFIWTLLINQAWVSGLEAATFLSILYVGIFGGAAYYLLYQYAIKHGTPVIASMTMYLQPTATFFWAFFLLSERLTLTMIIGAALAIFGAYLVSFRSK